MAKPSKIDTEAARLSTLERGDLEKAAIGYMGLSRRLTQENEELKRAVLLSSKKDSDLISAIIALAEYAMGPKFTGVNIEFSTRDYYWLVVGFSDGDKTILSREKSPTDLLAYWMDSAKKKRDRQNEEIVAIDNILSKIK